MSDAAPADRPLDLVLYGASGFVGRLTAEHVARHAPAGLRVGLAGRSPDRLRAVRDGLGPAARDWPIVIADASDAASLAGLARGARVVVTTVGPYLRYGIGLVEACADAGTHYADLTGEVLFVRRAADRFHARAIATGARIVPSCGFDSVPSDLAVLALHTAAAADGAGDLEDVTLTVTSMRGGLSGGTIDSLRAQIDEVRADASLRHLLADPYGLSPDRATEPDLGDERDGGGGVGSLGVGRDADTGAWTGPFVMASYNTRIVRRSNALLDWAYGRRFRYREVISYGTSVAAPVLAAGSTGALGAMAAGLAFGPARVVLDRLLPRPGQGPGEETRRRGRFAMEVRARTSSNARYVAHVAAQGDPGYAATSVMLGESGLCLALDGDRLPARAGVLTPATAMGAVLADRLRAAGFRLEVEALPARDEPSGP
jgi:short subunit dehydrogenase-like uncharacterized protein